MNDDTRTQLRRYTTNLACSGGGYIMLGLWTVVKIFMTVTMNRPFFEEVMSEVDISEMNADEQKLFHILLIFFFIVLAAVAFVVHFYIGSSAISYSKGKKKSRFFIAAGAVLMIMTLIGIPKYFTDYEEVVGKYNDSAIASTLVDLTACFILADILYSVFRIDRIRKEGGRE